MANNRCSLAGACNGTQHKMAKHSCSLSYMCCHVMLGSLACQLCRDRHYLTIACWIPLQAHVLANASNMQWQKLAQACCNDLLPLCVGAGACKGPQHQMTKQRCSLPQLCCHLCWAGACHGTEHKMANIGAAFHRCVAILCWAPLRASFVTIACWIPLKHTCLRTHLT